MNSSLSISNSSKLWSIYLAPSFFVITLTLCAILLLRECVSSSQRTLNSVAGAINQVFSVQPQVTINSQVIQTQTEKIAELALLQRNESVSVQLNEHEEFMNWPILLTAKSLTAQAVYRVKAGFDLSQPFRVTLDQKTGRVQASFPPAKILSVEMISEVTSSDSPGWLNGITSADRQKIMALLNEKARAAAEESSLTQEAEATANDRLMDLLRKSETTDFDLLWDTKVK
jgi:hypothetical protein